MAVVLKKVFFWRRYSGHFPKRKQLWCHSQCFLSSLPANCLSNIKGQVFFNQITAWSRKDREDFSWEVLPPGWLHLSNFCLPTKHHNRLVETNFCISLHDGVPQKLSLLALQSRMQAANLQGMNLAASFSSACLDWRVVIKEQHNYPPNSAHHSVQVCGKLLRSLEALETKICLKRPSRRWSKKVCRL